MNEEYIGIDLGGTKLLIICGDERYRIETGPEFSPASLEANIRHFLKDRNIVPKGIGIAMPGLVDQVGHIGVCDVLPKMTGWAPTEAFADLGCKVVAINDVRAALAEEMHDVEEGTTAGVIMVGTAVGAAFLTGGRTLIGATGWAGELGYMPISINGEVKRLDELAGGSFLASKLNVNGKRLAELANSGDPSALAVIREGGYSLGIAVAGVINLFNPSRLAFGGGTLSLPGYFDAVKVTAAQYTISELWQVCSLSRICSGESVAALGALRHVQV